MRAMQVAVRPVSAGGLLPHMWTTHERRRLQTHQRPLHNLLFCSGPALNPPTSPQPTHNNATTWNSSVFGFEITTAELPSSTLRILLKQSSVEQSANVSASVKPI